MDNQELKVASLVSRLELSLSKVLVHGVPAYLLDPSSPVIFDLGYLLNASIKIIPSANYTTQLPDGSLGGVGGLVINGEADLGGDAAMFEPHWAEKGLSLLHPTHSERLYIFFNQPTALENEGLLLKPFELAVWVCSVFIWIAFISSIQLFRYFKRVEEESWWSLSSFGDIILWAIASISNRSYNFQPDGGIGMKILIVCGLQFGVIILSIYSGFIVSSLTFKAEPIKAFKDLVNYRYLIVGKPELSFEVFEENRIEANRLWEISKKNFKGPEDLFLKVFHEPNKKPAFFIVHGWFHRLSRIKNYSDIEICKVSQISTAMRYPLAMFVKTHSKLKEILNQKILLVMQTGLNHRYLIRAAELYIPKCEAPKHIPEPLSISNVRVMFLIMAVGCVLALFFLSMEATLRSPERITTQQQMLLNNFIRSD